MWSQSIDLAIIERMKFFSELDASIGKNIIFLDIDGTLTEEGSDRINSKVLRKIAEFKKKNDIYLCSNSDNVKRNRKVAKICGVPYLDTPLRKPNKNLTGLVQNKKNRPLMVIGNLALMDGRFAKNIGGTFIQVKTLVGSGEPWLNRVFYFLDAKIFSHFI